jgi:hypothetical protein
MDKGMSGPNMLPARSVNDDIRRAAANLAIIIRECGVSQAELSRRSGLSRQLINGWARQRVPVSLSPTVGRFLSGIQLTLADLLLEEDALYSKLGKTPRGEGEPIDHFLPHLIRSSNGEEGRQRLSAIAGVYRYRTRLKESPIFVIEMTFEIEPTGDQAVVRAFDGPRVGNKPFAEGFCFHHQKIFFIFNERTDPPHQPLLYAFRDPDVPKIRSMQGVAISPTWIGPVTGHPLTRLVYMHRINPDGSAIADSDFDPDREFNTFVPADACTVLATF